MSRGAIRIHSSAAPRLIGMCASLLVIALSGFTPVAAAAQQEGISLEDARQQLTALQQELAEPKTERRLLELRAQALELQSQLRNASGEIAPQLEHTEARIAQLGAAPEDAEEPDDVAAQRRELEYERASLEGQLRLAGLLSLEADQIVAQIAALSREQLRQRVGSRARSPLGSSFWEDLRAEAPGDLRRLMTFAAELKAAFVGSSVVAWAGALLIAVFTLRARSWLAGKVLSLAPPERLRRSLRAFTHVVLWTLSAVIIASAIIIPLASSHGATAHLAELLSDIRFTAVFGVYVAALGAALLSAHASGWRLPALSDEVALTLGRHSNPLAIVITLALLVEQLATSIDLGLRMSVALNGLMTFVLTLALARGLRRGAQAQAAVIDGSRRIETPLAQPAPALWMRVIVGIGWTLLVGSALCVLLGYIALGSFVVKQAVWVLVVLCTAYLLAVVIDDVLMVLPNIWRTKLPRDSVSSTRTPAAVLVSALVRVAIGLFALALLLAPFGAGAIDLLPNIHRVEEGIAIGALHLRPGAVIRGILILVLGFGAVTYLRRWTEQRYLPVTRMDAGMRASVASLVGYAGYVVVIALTLSAIGLRVQQIAWVASALALGIGFGLQAIVQNFVSGLILLAERPIKVGDWVVLNEFEGDVRRINARATEIQKRDRSTIIVPNSEFITKVVRNVTYASPLGRVQILLPIAVGSDVERVRAQLLQAFRSHPDILHEPAPEIALEGIEAGNVLFSAIGFVMSPRAVYDVRSAILFDVLARLNEGDIPVHRIAEVVAKPEPA